MNAEALVLRARMESSGELSIGLRGNCMEPLLKAGDMARIAPADGVETGRVYLLELPGNRVALHRVIAVRDDCLMSKGDYSSMYEVLPKKSVVGILAAVRLNGSGPWHGFEERALSRWIGVALSRNSVYDKRLGKESHLHRTGRLTCKRILAFLSQKRRRRWQGRP
jgi:hypothetical protein